MSTQNSSVFCITTDNESSWEPAIALKSYIPMVFQGLITTSKILYRDNLIEGRVLSIGIWSWLVTSMIPWDPTPECRSIVIRTNTHTRVFGERRVSLVW